jgi:exonuclease III
MTFVYRIVTLNINGIQSDTRLQMLHLLSGHDVDIVLLQEVSTPYLNTVPRYTEYSNREMEGRGTAILIKDRLQVTNIVLLPSGRGIAADIAGTRVINIYTPSGADKQAAREDFFPHEP